jgi:site-specific recombinase XerD
LVANARKCHNANCENIAEILNIPILRGHVPRHTLANHMLQKGISITEIQHTLAHSSVTTTEIYAADRLDNMITKQALKKVYDNENFKFS